MQLKIPSYEQFTLSRLFQLWADQLDGGLAIPARLNPMNRTPDESMNGLPYWCSEKPMHEMSAICISVAPNDSRSLCAFCLEIRIDSKIVLGVSFLQKGFDVFEVAGFYDPAQGPTQFTTVPQETLEYVFLTFRQASLIPATALYAFS